jgi:hypothetical protein
MLIWCIFATRGPPRALEGALTDDIIDVAWTQITVNNARELQIDFTCPTFFYVSYYGRAGVGSTPPLPTVRCTTGVPSFT